MIEGDILKKMLDFGTIITSCLIVAGALLVYLSEPTKKRLHERK